MTSPRTRSRRREPLPLAAVRPSDHHDYAQLTVAATSAATFSRIFSALRATGYGEVRSVFIVGIAPPLRLIENFAPATGTTTAAKMSADALAHAQRVARDAAALLPTNIGARHCCSRGWGERLVRLVSISGCQCLFVDRADVRGWRLRGLRKRLRRIGIALVVVDPG